MNARCTTIIRFANVARTYGLKVTEDRDGRVCADCHSAGSLHKELCAPGRKTRRAFDASSSLTVVGKLRMARFARHMRANHKEELTEFIYNGRFTHVSIKNGRDVDPSFWGEKTWLAHNNHCHCAV